MELFKKKISKKDELLLKLFEEGKYLRVDEDIDNKELMKREELREDSSLIIEEVPQIEPKQKRGWFFGKSKKEKVKKIETPKEIESKKEIKSWWDEYNERN